MMNRSGLSSLVGGAPRRGGLAHLARGETVLPSRAMQMDPSLRQHAMSSMARQGRDPMQYTVGARNLRNPSSGLSQFADLIYTENGYVDAATGQAASFGGNDFANTGTYQGGAPRVDGARPEAPSRPPAYIGPGGGGYVPGALDAELQGYEDYNAAGANNGPPSSSFSSLAALDSLKSTASQIQSLVSAAAPPPPVEVPLPSPEAPPPPQTYDQWQTPSTYDQWRDTRNPQGKGVVNQLYGQAMAAGTSMGIGQQPGSPNVLGTQIPTQSSMQWGTPGTALGFATDNANSQPSILNSGYQTPAYAGGAGPGWGGQGGGIGSPGISGGGGQQQGQRRQPNLQAAFQY